MTRRLVARLDNLGDVLLAGPAIRAVAASGDPVDVLVSNAGAAAARLLPGVDDVLTVSAPWVGDDAPPADPPELSRLIAVVADRRYGEAIILTSFHQSPLPLALLLRMAGVPTISATCVDHPGSLLDLRHPEHPELHEVEQALALCAAAGHNLPDGDDGSLMVRSVVAGVDLPPGQFVVVHPGASVPARALPITRAAEVVAAIVAAGTHVVVTGSAAEAALVERTARGAPASATTQAAGTLDLGRFAEVIRHARALVCGNTGPAHLAAAVGTPVVQAFGPVVPPHRWRPWKVWSVQLGDESVPCGGCRARTCPEEGQPCLAPFTPSAVLAALNSLPTGGPGTGEELAA